MTGLQVSESACPGIEWPALPAGRAATLLALEHQLERSQWWPPETLLKAQLRQLETVLAHALQTVPFYRERLRAVAGLRRGELGLDMFRHPPGGSTLMTSAPRSANTRPM